VGHIRLGRLPKRWGWRQVFGVLEQESTDPELVAQVTAHAASRDLEQLRHTPDAVAGPLWLLANIATASRQSDFGASLEELGIPSRSLESSVGLIAALSNAEAIDYPPNQAVFASFAKLSLRDALSEHLAGRTGSLFGGTRDDIVRACAELSKPTVFGAVTRRYFAAFSFRLVRYVVDRESSNGLFEPNSSRDSADLISLERRLAAYCFDSARIVEDYAASWFSKWRHLEGGAISRDSASRFSSYAMRKLEMELEQSS